MSVIIYVWDKKAREYVRPQKRGERIFFGSLAFSSDGKLMPDAAKANVPFEQARQIAPSNLVFRRLSDQRGRWLEAETSQFVVTIREEK